MKKLTNSTKGGDLGTPRGRDNGEGQAGKASEVQFCKKLPLPAIETDPDFPATVLSAATVHIRHKPALQRDAVQTTTKPTFHRQLSAQRKADLPRLIPGRCSPPNLPGRPQGPCGDLPHKAVQGSNKRDRSSSLGSSQKHLVNPPWAPCKVVDPTYIGNIYFDRLPKGLKHLEPVDMCYRHGHHRRLNPLGKTQNEGSLRRSCTNLRAHIHKQKVQEKKVIPVAVVTEASTDDKPEDVEVGENRNRKSLDIDADLGSKPDPCDLLKSESYFVSSIEYQTDNNSCRSSSSVSNEQNETYPSETSQVTEQLFQMPSSANGECQLQSTTFCQTIPTCKLAENLQQTTQGFLGREHVDKETLIFSVSSENSLSDDELKVPDENPHNKNTSKPHIERRGSLSSCLPKAKLRTDEDISKSFSALSSKENELVDNGKTNHTMPHHEHREEMVEKHVCTDVEITKETVPVVHELGDNSCNEVKKIEQQQEETSYDTPSLGSPEVETPVTKPTTPLTKNVICPNTETKTDVSDERNKPVLVDSVVSTVTTHHGDSKSPTNVSNTKIPTHKLLSLSEEVSTGTRGDPPKVVMHSKVPVRSLAGKIHEPSTKTIIKQTLPPAFQNEHSEESFGSVGRHRPEQEKLKYSKVSQDVPIDPTSTRCKVDRACTNKTRSNLKTKAKKETNSAIANLRETSSKRESEKPKPIIEENTQCPDEIKPETVLFKPGGSQLETVDADTDQKSFEVCPDLAIGVRLFRTPVDEVRRRVSDLEIQPLETENRPPSKTHTEGDHQILDVGEKVDNVINDDLLMIQQKSKEDCTEPQERDTLLMVEVVPQKQPVVAEDIQNDHYEETCGGVVDNKRVILTKPEEVLITAEDNMQNETGKRVTLLATDVDIFPQSDVKSGMDNETSVQGMTKKSELPSSKNVDRDEDLGDPEGESLTMYVPPLPCSSATQELTTEGLSQDRTPCRWRINLDSNRLDHLLQVQDNLIKDGSRGRGDWKERPVNYVDPNVPLEDMLTKYFTDHTPLDSAFRAINIVNSYSSSISYNSHQAQERVVAALQSIKQEEVYKHAVICPLASQCANATREFGESLYKAFRRFSNRSMAAQEAMIEYYRTLAEGENTAPEMMKQIKLDGKKLYMVWEGGRYVTRYAEDDECTGSSDETIADDDTTGSSLTHSHNPATDRK